MLMNFLLWFYWQPNGILFDPKLHGKLIFNRIIHLFKFNPKTLCIQCLLRNHREMTRFEWSSSTTPVRLTLSPACNQTMLVWDRTAPLIWYIPAVWYWFGIFQDDQLSPAAGQIIFEFIWWIGSSYQLIEKKVGKSNNIKIHYSNLVVLKNKKISGWYRV